MKRFYVATEEGDTLGRFKTIENARRFRDEFMSRIKNLIILVKTKNEE